MGGPCHARRGVAVYRLGHDAIAGHLGQLLHHEVHILHIGVDEDMVGGYHIGHPVIRALQQRAPGTEKIDELLGKRRPAARPQTPPLATGKDKTIEVVSFCHFTKFRFNLMTKLRLKNESPDFFALFFRNFTNIKPFLSIYFSTLVVFTNFASITNEQ